MKKDKILLLLAEGLTVEEVSNLTSLDEIRVLIEKSGFDSSTKEKLESGLNILKKDTIDHSNSFSEMMKSVIKSDKNEY